MLSRLLYLPPDLLRRGWPFFALYLVLFAALTLADGLSLTLFVQQLGADALPRYQALSAACVLAAVGAYLTRVDRWEPSRMFLAILAAPILLLGGVWLLILCRQAGGGWLGLVYVGRELAFALVLLHFGTYLQTYFRREELTRAMPVIYAGGRVGGILAGALLEHAAGLVAPSHLLAVAVGLLLAGVLGVVLIGWRFDGVSDRGESAERDVERPIASGNDRVTDSFSGFLRFVVTNPLMAWISITTVVYFACRAFLNYRYNQCFEASFASDVEMARFLGRYTQWALAGSLILQLFVINRWIAWVGLRGAQVTYSLLLLAAALSGAFEMTLATAVFARLVEGELRYGLRNPIAQLIVNQFSRSQRIRARAWSMGLLIPVSTLGASLLLATLVQTGQGGLIALATAGLGGGYFYASWRMARLCLTEGRSARGDSSPEVAASHYVSPESTGGSAGGGCRSMPPLECSAASISSSTSPSGSHARRSSSATRPASAGNWPSAQAQAERT